MSHFQLVILCFILLLLIFLSSFFSAAETGLMAVNRYRLRHKAHMKKRTASLILQMLKRPDRLLGMIVIGNTLAMIIASAITTLLAVHFYGAEGVVVSTMILTLVMLVFSEVAPKTLAALYSDNTSKLVAWPLYFMLKLFYPIVWAINFLSNGLLRLFGIRVGMHTAEPLNQEELRSIVYDTAGRVSTRYQKMMLAMMDLNTIVVEEIMTPSHQVIGIDLDKPWEEIRDQMRASQYDWLPVYHDHINQIIGILHLRDVIHVLAAGEKLDKTSIQRLLQEPYFIPESTLLNIQLFNFQRERKRVAFIVDEYGNILGLISLEDILEEIVGEFTTNIAEASKVQCEPDGSYIVNGALTVRECNRLMGIQLPTKGARTLNGLITDYLEAMPKVGTSVKIANYPIEILRVEENRVELARIFPLVS